MWPVMSPRACSRVGRRCGEPVCSFSAGGTTRPSPLARQARSDSRAAAEAETSGSWVKIAVAVGQASVDRVGEMGGVTGDVGWGGVELVEERPERSDDLGSGRVSRVTVIAWVV